MKNRLIIPVFFIFFLSINLLAQELPEIIPPSPTVANLMKFEEVPVNNYTGIPDISIPIYSTTGIGGYPINVSLSYHPSGVVVDNIASWVGNGWSLNAGGAISRTVYDKPDEQLQYGLFYNGLLNTGFNFLHTDNTALIYDIYANNRYDTEADLFQFNFMGMSGRFYFQGTSNSVVVVSANREYKIKAIMDTSPGNSEIIGFTIIDDKGYKYMFMSSETTTKTPIFHIISSVNLLPSTVFSSAWNLSEIRTPNNELICSFNYTQVKEIYAGRRVYVRNKNRTPEAMYSTLNIVKGLLPEISFSSSNTQVLTKKLTSIDVVNKGRIIFSKNNGREDLIDDVNVMTGSYLSKIEVENEHSQNIVSYDLLHSFEGVGNRLVLNELRQNNRGESDYFAYKFKYNNIENLPEIGSSNVDYWGYYNGVSNNNLIFPPSVDEGILFGADRSTNSSKVTTGVLEEIEYPTGGVKKFVFEPHTYSYIGNQLQDSLDIPENRVSKSASLTESMNYSSVGSVQKFIYIEKSQIVDVNLKVLSYSSLDAINMFRTRITPVVLNQLGEDYISQNTSNLNLIPNISHFETFQDPTRDRPKSFFIDECLPENSNLPGEHNVTSLEISDHMVLNEGWYKVEFESTDCFGAGSVEMEFDLSYYNMNYVRKYVTGGGLRIQKVKFKEENNVLKEKEYRYQLFDDNSLSSGSLISFPFFRYSITKGAIYQWSATGGYHNINFTYDVTTDYNNLNVQKTQGDIGYKNVEVIEIKESEESLILTPISPPQILLPESENGSQRFTYTSPIDYPEIIGNGMPINSYPFISSLNLGYKRGLLLKTEIYSSDLKKLQVEERNYNFDEQVIKTGYKVYNNQHVGCGYPLVYPGYQSFIDNEGCYGINVYGSSNSLIRVLPVEMASGWAKLNSITSETFFHDPVSLDINSITTEKSYTYGASHKQLVRTGTTTSKGENFQTKTKYPEDILNPSEAVQKMVELHMLAEPIEISSNKVISINSPNSVGDISKSETEFYNFDNDFVLPKNILTSKGGNSLEDRITFHDYDAFGNPLEVSKTDGARIIYVWGYNDTQPIAKIENASYDGMSPELLSVIDIAKTASNNDDDHCREVGCKEENLRNALENLRSHSDLSGSMVTTYTYDPLIGVTSITDARGQTIYYDYDGFNRLKQVKDQDGNILSKNDYNYKLQN